MLNSIDVAAIIIVALIVGSIIYGIIAAMRDDKEFKNLTVGLLILIVFFWAAMRVASLFD